MVDALKKLDKKFLIIAGIILILPILIIVFLAIVRGCDSHKISYENYEKRMLKAATRYFKGKTPKEESETATVDLSVLVEKKYIKSPEKLLKDESCIGSVTVRRNGASIESNNGGFLNYTVNLECDEYSTNSLFKKIIADAQEEPIAPTESGLYFDGSEYIFKGNKVKNHVNFFGKDYRIVSIDSNGIIKLIRSESEGLQKLWDNKFNVETNSTSGKNIYKDSSLLVNLIGEYQNSKKISKKAKPHVVGYDVCVGKRANSNYEISKQLDCSEILENQVISLLNISDFANASTDPDCTSTKSRACRNYNYLANIASTTWTMNASSENTYEVFFITDGIQDVQNAREYNEYNIVIYVDGNELYTEGSGSSGNPYIIK